MLRALALVVLIAPTGASAASLETKRVCKAAGEMGLHFTSAVTMATTHLLLSIKAAEEDGGEPDALASLALDGTNEFMQRAIEKMDEISELCGLED